MRVWSDGSPDSLTVDRLETGEVSIRISVVREDASAEGAVVLSRRAALALGRFFVECGTGPTALICPPDCPGCRRQMEPVGDRWMCLECRWMKPRCMMSDTRASSTNDVPDNPTAQATE